MPQYTEHASKRKWFEAICPIAAMYRSCRPSAASALVVIVLVAPVTAQNASSTNCSPSETTHKILRHASELWRGIKRAPRNAVRSENLKWELPIGAATGLLIAEADQPAANRIESKSLINTARVWSNIGLASEIGLAGVTWGGGCIEHKPSLIDNGVVTLTAIGAASTLDLGLKLAFDREFPYKPGSHGAFWGGGRSFPSGHSAASFAFASAIAHRYPHKRWVKWGAYGLAAGVALSRYPAKRHYFSDILVGSTLGYVTGAYVAEHR